MIDLEAVEARHRHGQIASDPAVIHASMHDVPALVAELRAAREQIDDYENAITWGVSCTSCARVLDASIADHDRAERAEAELRAARKVLTAVAAFLDAPHCTPRFQSAYDALHDAKAAYDQAVTP